MKKANYQLGLVSISFRQHTPEEILEEMKRVNLSCIEWGSDVHAPCTDMEGLYKLAALQKKYGICCSSYGTYFRLGETPIEELENYIHAAKILETNILRLWCGNKIGTDMTDKERNEFLSICRQAATIAELNGVRLCMECHKNTFTENPEDAVWLMEKIKSSHFRMYWQPFQWQTVDQNIENAKKIAPYTEHIHVFNWKKTQMLPLAEAVDEWRAFLAQFSSPRTLLLEFMPKGSINELKSETNALKFIVGESI